MLTIHSPRHVLRAATTELAGGLLVRPFESPERVAFVLERLAETGFGDILEPRDFGLEPILRVHDGDFVDFLAHAWDDWKASGAEGEAIPIVWPARRMSTRVPREIGGRLGHYALAAETSISAGTWEAACASANVALEATERVRAGERAVFGLCRPPGHHAARDMYGGYCFLNNAAIAAQRLRDGGASRVAILDVDFHHGNGTQDIFFDRGDVFYASIHGDPAETFPYFLGHADEVGTGAGEGANLNVPLGPGIGWSVWGDALSHALDRLVAFGAEALVVSLGVDTHEADPHGFFRLTSDDFLRLGARIGRIGLPTVFLMEGGYAVAELGVNAVNVLTGFENA